MSMTLKECLALASRMEPAIEMMNAVGFADMKIPAPSIHLFEDRDMYFDPQENTIHLGMKLVYELGQPKNEEELFSAVNYFRGHEEQHRRSTATAPYRFAIQDGFKAVVEYISLQVDGKKKIFYRNADYERYIKELEKRGIVLRWDDMQSFMAGLTNSLEDGRIERLRANRFPGFAALRKTYRGKFWYFAGADYLPYEEMKNNPVEILKVISMEILSLATCNLYSRNFSVYEDTPIVAMVDQFKPAIARAVMSGRTKGLIAPMREIATAIAPYVYEAFRMSEQDVQLMQALQQLMQQLASRLVEQAIRGELSERDEDTDDGSISSLFQHSDLVVVLPDEEYDKLMEKRKENGEEGNSGGGILVQREHPLENEDNPKEGKDGSKQENGADGRENEGENEPSQDGEKTLSGSSTKRSTTKEATIKAKQEKKHVSNEEIKGAEKEVLKAMQEAATTANAEAQANIESVNIFNAKCKRNGGRKEITDKTPVIKPAEMKDICSFLELKRQYKVKDDLPAADLQKGRTLHQKNEQYFRSLATPSVSYQESGMIDPGRIYGLAIGDTDVFRRRGTPKTFDGCAYILIDNSGSMAGEKRKEACRAAAIIEEGFKGLLPFKIVAFDYNRTVIHEVVKGWDESLNKNCCWNFYKSGRTGCGNEDGFNIQVATRELLARPEKKKLLLVLSDGTPGNPAYCKKAIEHARKMGITVCGIYFEIGECVSNQQFADMYQKNYICCPLDQLLGNLTRTFHKFSRS